MFFKKEPKEKKATVSVSYFNIKMIDLPGDTFSL